MSYYLRSLPNWPSAEVWQIEGDEAKRLGIQDPQSRPGAYFKAAPGETIWTTLRSSAPGFESGGEWLFLEARLQPGAYHPRMARPSLISPLSPGVSPGTEREYNFVATAHSQLTVLSRQLGRICQTVHPTPQTFETFGHDIRNLLILSCTEAEAHWRGVLRANGVMRVRLTTADYVRLLPAMKLDEYSVAFPSYPWLEAIQPYKGWGASGKATPGLKWYAAYNAIKHDREGEFERSTLRHAFEALSACVVMMAAQFGPLAGSYPAPEPLSFFRLSAVPNWPLSDRYIPPYDGAPWTPVNFPF